MKQRRKKIVQVVLEDDFKLAVEQEAKRRRTSVSNLIRSRLTFCLPENIRKPIKAVGDSHL